MKKLESNIVNMAVVMTCIAVVAAALLALMNNVTSGPIEKINQQAIADGVKSVILGDSDVEFTVQDPIEKDGFVFHRVYDSQNNLLGTAVESSTNGFGGTLKIMTGFAPDGVILGYEVLEHAETPGLGANAGAWFKQKASAEVASQSAFADVMLGAPQKAGNHNIVGMNPATSDIRVSKDGGEIDAITASTITSRAFLKAVTEAYQALMSNGQADGVSGATQQN